LLSVITYAQRRAGVWWPSTRTGTWAQYEVLNGLHPSLAGDDLARASDQVRAGPAEPDNGRRSGSPAIALAGDQTDHPPHLHARRHARHDDRFPASVCAFESGLDSGGDLRTRGLQAERLRAGARRGAYWLTRSRMEAPEGRRARLERGKLLELGFCVSEATDRRQAHRRKASIASILRRRWRGCSRCGIVLKVAQ
jgi:hypothetical protein